MTENNQKLRYGLYCRKSSEDSAKQIVSIQNQSQVLNEKADKEGLKIIKVYTESKSARKPYRREKFNQMIADLQDGVIDGIICWKLDRLSRNPTDGGTVQQLLFDEVIKAIVTYERIYYPGDDSIMMSFELGMATEYSRALGKNVKRGQGYKVSKGVAPGKAPLGYLNTTERKKGEKEITPDLERFDLVRKLWDLLLSNEYSVLQILEKAKGIGLTVPGTRNKPTKPLTKTGLYKLFRNRFYCKEFKWSGTWHENGTQKLMVTKKEFERVQEIISRRERTKKNKHIFAFTNLVKCGCCKASIIAEHKDKVRKDGSINYRTYYRCTHRKTSVACTQKAIREEELERQLTALVSSITIPNSFVQWAARYLQEENEESTAKQEAIKEQQRKQIDKIDKQISRLIDLKLELGEDMDNETFKSKKDALISEKRIIEKEMALNTDCQDYRAEKTIEVFELCRETKSVFENGTSEEKKLALRALGSHLSLLNGILAVMLPESLKSVQDANKIGFPQNPRFATLETRTRPGLDEESCQLIKLGGGEEELPTLYKEFKAIYKQEFGIKLSDEEAENIGGRLLKLAKAIIIHKQNKNVKTESLQY